MSTLECQEDCEFVSSGRSLRSDSSFGARRTERRSNYKIAESSYDKIATLNLAAGGRGYNAVSLGRTEIEIKLTYILSIIDISSQRQFQSCLPRETTPLAREYELIRASPSMLPANLFPRCK